MKLGIYGGTFSPIHMGHIRSAEEFLENFGLDRLLVIPTAIPPHKAEVVGASAHDRYEMARLAFNGHDRITVSDFEITRGGRSYTVCTLEHFKPGNELYMLVGTDMFLTLGEWFRAADIFSLADIVLKRREDEKHLGELIAEKTNEYRARFGAKIHIISESAIQISSTAIREMLNSSKQVKGYIPDSVVDYINKNNLYQQREDET